MDPENINRWIRRNKPVEYNGMFRNNVQWHFNHSKYPGPALRALVMFFSLDNVEILRGSETPAYSFSNILLYRVQGISFDTGIGVVYQGTSVLWSLLVFLFFSASVGFPYSLHYLHTVQFLYFRGSSLS